MQTPASLAAMAHTKRNERTHTQARTHCTHALHALEYEVTAVLGLKQFCSSTPQYAGDSTTTRRRIHSTRPHPSHARHDALAHSRSAQFFFARQSGVFRCACCGAPLFYAKAKFEPPGDGWPAFHSNGSWVANGTWAKNGSSTVCTPGGTEVVCSNCGSHLGDFFAAGSQGPYACTCARWHLHLWLAQTESTPSQTTNNPKRLFSSEAFSDIWHLPDRKLSSCV
jgi:peptide methionine sulfoxide reductase MsrB